MRRKKAWTPAAEDREMLTEHLFHEVQMTFFLASELNKPTSARIDLSLRNAQIEAFAFHLGQLVEFFWCEQQRTDANRDAFAADYFREGEWARIRPGLPAILEKALRDRVGWGIAPLTYNRDWVRPADKVWDAVSQAFALAPVVRRFVDAVDHTQFIPGYANGMRACAEMFVDARRASTANPSSATDVAA